MACESGMVVYGIGLSIEICVEVGLDGCTVCVQHGMHIELAG